MTIRNAPLFGPGGHGTPVLFGQWRRRMPAQPIQARNVLVERDGTATKYFRDLWRAAFPTREPLPLEPIADRDGLGTGRFWDLLA